ncbi:MAG TPA: (deoxy)nucleoside triphosphate pyrophosphohydrolase [Patescibacteria group bacterium]|nr:(deoxy)nucleoside triphosphate pyrophosphohydrolase [Patescibacteria group bacterium]
MPDSRKTSSILIVVAAVAVREGRVLLTRRKPGAHLEHHWEFPGGKLEPGEEPAHALIREIEEELGVEATVEAPFAFNYHAYPEKRVLLLTYAVSLAGRPEPLGCAELGWFDAEAVGKLLMPPADGPILERLIPRLVAGRSAGDPPG